MQIFRATVTVHDFFTTISKELKVGLPSSSVGNTTLLYALNIGQEKLHRIASQTRPLYDEDVGRFSVYATAGEHAGTGSEVALKGTAYRFGHEGGLVKITYNSVDSTQLISMQQTVFHKKEEKLNFPKLGHYMYYPPLSTIRLFVLGGTGPSVIRLGKKLPPARVIYEKLENIHFFENGEFVPDHPVQVADLSKDTQILSGTIAILPNGLLLSNSRLKGKYYTGTIRGKRYTVAPPDFTKFVGVKND